MIFKDPKEFLDLVTANKRLMCLDFGMKKIGVAITDPLAKISIPFDTIIRKNIKTDIQKISQVISEFSIKAIIIGYPISMNGEENENCIRVVDFATKISDILKLPILLFDERFSTKMANRLMIEANISKKIRQEVDDRISASIILEDAIKLFDNLKQF